MSTLQLLLASAIVLLGIGLYGLLVIRNMIKVVIALQIMVKGAMLALIAAGGLTDQLNLGQSLALAVITADTLVAIIGLALATKLHQHFATVNIDEVIHSER